MKKLYHATKFGFKGWKDILHESSKPLDSWDGHTTNYQLNDTLTCPSARPPSHQYFSINKNNIIPLATIEEAFLFL